MGKERICLGVVASLSGAVSQGEEVLVAMRVTEPFT